jgi:hypothetical protein
VTQQEASNSNAQQIKSMVERSNGIDSSHVSSATLQGQVTFFILLFLLLNLLLFLEYEHQGVHFFLMKNIKFVKIIER